MIYWSINYVYKTLIDTQYLNACLTLLLKSKIIQNICCNRDLQGRAGRNPLLYKPLLAGCCLS